MNSDSVQTRSFKRRSQRTRTGPQQGTNDLRATLDPPVTISVSVCTVTGHQPPTPSNPNSHFLLIRFLHKHLVGEADEFRKSLHQILQASFLLQVKGDLRVALDLPVHFGVVLHGEGDTGHRLPDVLNILKALADDTNLVRNQIGRKEADLELPKISLPGTRLGDSPEIVQELVLNRPPANPPPALHHPGTHFGAPGHHPRQM